MDAYGKCGLLRAWNYAFQTEGLAANVVLHPDLLPEEVATENHVIDTEIMLPDDNDVDIHNTTFPSNTFTNQLIHRTRRVD